MSLNVSLIRSGVRATLLTSAAWAALTPAIAQVAPAPTPTPVPAAPQTQSAASVPADAQASPASDATVTTSPPVGESGLPEAGLQDIVVTARRVSENLQRVPISITAVTPEVVSRNNITDITGLQRIVPSYQGGAKFLNNSIAAGAIRIRGVPSVANYFNDVPFSAAGRAPYFDIQNIQVLQGPQGTLFGEASNAGAIVITPRKPGNKFAGFAEIEVGDRGRKVFSGAIDIPIIPDKVLLRISGKTGYVDGYIQDTLSETRVGADDYDLGRIILTLRPTSKLEIETMFSTETMRNDGVSPGTLADFNFFPSFNSSAQAAVNGMTVAQYNAARDYVLSVQEKIGPYRFQGWSTGCYATAISPALKSKVPGPDVASVVPNSCTVADGYQRPQLLTNTIKWDFAENFTLKHIFGASGNTLKTGLFDTDLTRLIIRDTNTNPLGPRITSSPLWNFQNWSSEVQLIGSLWDKRLTFVTGVFNRRTANQGITGALNGNIVFAQFSTSLADVATRPTNSTRTTAVYGQGDFKITDRLIATAGVRQTWDDIKQKTEILNPVTLAVVSTTGGPGKPSGEGKFSSFSYTAGLRYQLSNDTMFYFTHAKGYSAGGLQNVAGNEQFRPDNLYNFEVGAKTTLHAAEGFVIRGNFSAYYGLFENVKISQGALIPIPGTSGTQFVTITSNAGKARVTGLSADVSADIHNRVQLSVQGAYMHNYYTKYDSINPLTGAAVDLSSTPFVNTPDWKITAAATYTLPVDEQRIGRISIGADFTATPETWGNIGKPIIPNNPADPNTGAICKLQRTAANFYGPLSADGKTAYKDCVPSSYNINARLDWRNPLGYDGLRASLVVTNLTGFEGYSGIGFSYDSTGYTNIYPVPPRYVYLNLRFDW